MGRRKGAKGMSADDVERAVAEAIARGVTPNLPGVRWDIYRETFGSTGDADAEARAEAAYWFDRFPAKTVSVIVDGSKTSWVFRRSDLETAPTAPTGPTQPEPTVQPALPAAAEPLALPAPAEPEVHEARLATFRGTLPVGRLRRLLTMLEPLRPEERFDVQPDGIHVRSVDPSCVSMGVCFLPAKEFDTYTLTGPSVLVGVNDAMTWVPRRPQGPSSRLTLRLPPAPPRARR